MNFKFIFPIQDERPGFQVFQFLKLLQKGSFEILDKKLIVKFNYLQISLKSLLLGIIIGSFMVLNFSDLMLTMIASLVSVIISFLIMFLTAYSQLKTISKDAIFYAELEFKRKEVN